MEIWLGTVNQNATVNAKLIQYAQYEMSMLWTDFQQT
jgi:hypothetical protein